ncbi:hypothetical protein RclHR1_24360001 [Rhizophagus clarus]|uniref:Uncharacterized protein n=1 Tax=Rhizophagus clarus TaxID=94130 RepID=A0A2Z6RS64_9GLOM|nr:hypothetical protein RclHR1_24360001 [Rhizophagus clarus]
MSDIRLELVNSVINKAYSLIDYNIHNDIHKQQEFKSKAIKLLTKSYDSRKILYNEGMRRSYWTSGNDDVDNLIQQCQMETITPDRIKEWTTSSTLNRTEYMKNILSASKNNPHTKKLSDEVNGGFHELGLMDKGIFLN